MKTYIKIFPLLLIALMLTSCGQAKLDEEIKSYADEKIVISGLQDENFEISVAELMELDTVTESAVSNRSNGEEVKAKVTGPLLNTFLEKYGKSQKDFSVIRFSAKDNYSIAVPSDILNSKDIILAFMDKGKALTKEDQPVRAVIMGERAMYWVRMLNRIDFETGESAKLCDKIVFLDTAINNLPQEDYEYFGSVDKAVKTRDLIGKYADINDNTVKNVFMVAGDGLEKNETLSNFLGGYIKVNGEDVPKFLSPDLPQGMHLQDMLNASYGTTAFFSVYQGTKTLPITTIGQNEGIAFTDIIKKIGMVDANGYKLTSFEGESIELSVPEMANACIYLNDEGTVMFNSGEPANKTVNGLLSIEIIK